MANKYKIALIEDDQSVRTSLVLNLELEGYQIVTAENGQEGITLIEKECPDVIITDVMLPVMDGMQMCRELRNKGNSTPIIMLTARTEEVDKVLGLELGADDYIAKPFGVRELLARVKALLRRSIQTLEITTYQFGDISIDFKAYQAKKKEEPLELSAREYRLLKYLIGKIGDVVSRDELLDEVWGYNSYPTTRTVDNHIAKLRQKIEPNITTPRHILTIHGVGYKFVE